jgi:hypothetical protein
MHRFAEVYVEEPSSHLTVRWTETCGNAACRTGWLRLFRSRSFPRFEEKWACSAACTERMITDTLRGQIESWEPTSATRTLRMPLGLILLSRGWISRRELQEALVAQRRPWAHWRVAASPAQYFGRDRR